MSNRLPYSPHIVSAANKLGDTGVLLVGPRHWDSIMSAQWKALKEHEPFKSLKRTEIEQGFVTNLGVFVSREEAREIVDRTGQPLTGDNWGKLFSENLY